MRDPRNNAPINNVPLSAVKEVSIERGGFNAEYGQVRSGVVNVITKEGDVAEYTVSVSGRYSGWSPKNFGMSPFDRNSWWLRPYLDDAVCWTGTTNGAWDIYTQQTYDNFQGWNEISRQWNTDNNPNNNLSPEALQRLFLWQTRKRPVQDPDYNFDFTFGGPIPIISKQLGDLRFFSAYQQNKDMKLIPTSRDYNLNWDWNLRMNSDVSKSMKITGSYLAGKRYTEAENWAQAAYMTSPEDVARLSAGIEFWPNSYFSLTDISYNSISADMIHFITNATYYEVKIDQMITKYHTYPSRLRDTTKNQEIVPGYFVDETPFGYWMNTNKTVTGIETGGHTSKARDNSVYTATTLKFDFTSQLDFANMFKTGFEFAYNDQNIDYGQIASLSGGTMYENHVQMHVFPIRAGLYVQDKLETKGFVLNAGLRLDYSDSRSEWYDGSLFNGAYFSNQYNADNTYPMTKTKPQWQISPRVGISHPITENSKLYFNYGHFKQMPSYQNLFRIDRSSSGTVSNFGNPDLTLEKTIAYELGYDHSIADEYLLQVSAFYKDISNNQNTTTYYSLQNWSYALTTSTAYSDIRGFEITLRKNRGRFWAGFANYTYQSSSNGTFGNTNKYQDPVVQKTEDEKTINLYQNRPVPAPYARANVSFFTPDDFGPQWGSSYPLSGFMLYVTVEWDAGGSETYNPESIPGIQNNLLRTDDLHTTLRFSKTFKLKTTEIELFVDVNNVLNYKRMNFAGGIWGDAHDQEYYLASLHLPKSEAYKNIPGDDRSGDYREDNIAYQPMFSRNRVDPSTTGDAGVIYYDLSTDQYMEYTNNAWAQVDQARIDRILKDKAYINMPNRSSFTFLNPRQIFFGIKLSVTI
jgi:outer membrane receptor protein involved in Fe transport